MGDTPHIVILGGGFGGLKVAKGLKRAKARVTVIDRFNHHLFQPLLYQVATAGLSPADIAYPIRSIFKHQANTEVLLMEVTGIDAQKKIVLGNRSSIAFDFCVVATGAEYNYFGHENWRQAPSLKTISDATHIRQKILLAFEEAEMEADEKKRAALLNFVLVGGGPTGVEMAGAISELAHTALASDFRRIDPKAARIILIEAGDRVLPSFAPHLSEKARIFLERMGVEVMMGARVEDITEFGVTVSGHLIPSKNVIWAAGVKATPVGKWLGVETDRSGRVPVNPDLSVRGNPQIFVIGDAACVSDKNGKPLPGIAPVAMQEGDYVANLLSRKVSGAAVETSPFRYRDKGNLATVGRAFAVADFKRLKISGFFAWCVWLVVHIFYLIGFRNRLLVLTEWFWSYITFHRGARLITDSASEP